MEWGSRRCSGCTGKEIPTRCRRQAPPWRHVSNTQVNGFREIPGRRERGFPTAGKPTADGARTERGRPAGENRRPPPTRLEQVHPGPASAECSYPGRDQPAKTWRPPRPATRFPTRLPPCRGGDSGPSALRHREPTKIIRTNPQLPTRERPRNGGHSVWRQ